MPLLKICPACSKPCEVVDVRTRGSVLRCKRICSCNKETLWRSSPLVAGTKVASSDLLTSAAILFSGSTVEKALRMLGYMNLPVIDKKTFFKHQKLYLHKVSIRACINEYGNSDASTHF